MEAIFFAVDIVGMLLLLYWSIVNDKLPPGAPTTGLFAYRETIRRRPVADKRDAAQPPKGKGTPPPPPLRRGKAPPARRRR